MRIVRASPVAFDAPKVLYHSSFDVGISDVMSHDNIIIYDVYLVWMYIYHALGVIICENVSYIIADMLLDKFAKFC